MTTNLSVRPAQPDDAPAIAAIYNEGIEDRVATFETSQRSESDIAEWFDTGLPLLVVEHPDEGIVGYSGAFPYADRCCYAGIAEFSVYVRRDWRGRGVGLIAMKALIAAAENHGLWKLLSRIFPENEASLALMKSVGFRVVGMHERHGRLDGAWRDVVLVERLIVQGVGEG